MSEATTPDYAATLEVIKDTLNFLGKIEALKAADVPRFVRAMTWLQQCETNVVKEREEHLGKPAS